MKVIKNIAFYGLPLTSVSNICANEWGMETFGKLTNAALSEDKKDGFDLLNEKLFSKVNKGDLKKFNNIYFKYYTKDSGEIDNIEDNKKIEEIKEKNKNKDKNIFILFHGLGQSLDQYDDDINTLKKKFDADILLIEYNLNGEKTNTFADITKYCEEVAGFINSLGYKKNIFFGYSLGSFIGNLTRQKFNKNKVEDVKSIYIGYKGIKDLDNAGESFVISFLGEEGTKGENNKEFTLNILKTINGLLNIAKAAKNAIDGNIDSIFGITGIELKTFSDIFKLLLGNEQFNIIKGLTNNATILKNTKGFNIDNVEFCKELNQNNGHYIDLKEKNNEKDDKNKDKKKDIDIIYDVLNDENNKNKDVFLFQCPDGDNIVGTGMQDTFNSLKEESENNTEENNTQENNEIDNTNNIKVPEQIQEENPILEELRKEAIRQGRNIPNTIIKDVNNNGIPKEKKEEKKEEKKDSFCCF